MRKGSFSLCALMLAFCVSFSFSAIAQPAPSQPPAQTSGDTSKQAPGSNSQANAAIEHKLEQPGHSQH